MGINAKYENEKLLAENDVVKSGFKNITLEGAMREPGACTPFPSCLEEKRANNTCGDSYPDVSCISARRGEINLCAISEKIQQNCCTICTMSNNDLCIKERLMLAGMGDKGGNVSNVSVAQLAQFDPQCSVQTEKDFAGFDMARTAPLSPGYDTMVRNEYMAKFGGDDGSA